MGAPLKLINPEKLFRSKLATETLDAEYAYTRRQLSGAFDTLAWGAARDQRSIQTQRDNSLTSVYERGRASLPTTRIGSRSPTFRQVDCPGQNKQALVVAFFQAAQKKPYRLLQGRWVGDNPRMRTACGGGILIEAHQPHLYR